LYFKIWLLLTPNIPSMLHETPTRFSKTNSQTIMGYKMATSYTGSTFIPPILGFLASNTTLGIFPIFIVMFVAAMLFGSEKLNVIIKNRKLNQGINTSSAAL